jgi:hypothetical protein
MISYTLLTRTVISRTKTTSLPNWYGYQLADDAHYGKKGWHEVETQIQRSWEKEDE